MRNRVLVIVCLAGALTGCQALGIAGATHQRTLLIEHFAVECVGQVQRCLLVKEPGKVTFDLRAGGIEGFTYEWGYLYEVDVDETGSGSSIRTVLRKEVSRTRVVPGTEFDVVLTGAAVAQVSPGRYQFGSWPGFVCGSGVDCTQLVARLTAGKRTHFRLVHPALATDPLTVQQWVECAGGPGVYLCTQ